MSDLRARLAAKSARRVTQAIATADPTRAFEALRDATVALSLHPSDGDAKKLGQLTRAKAKAQKAYDDLFVDVEFEALSAADYEALLNAHIDPDAADDDPLVGDWDALLPELVAASCVDESLRDPQWWAEQLAQPAWSSGEKLNLRIMLQGLNMEWAVRAPKG